MITIHFEKSTSKFYPMALKLSDSFKKSYPGHLEPDIRDIFEFWDKFNQLFWLIIDWKGTYVEVDGVKHRSHRDKTGIFYSLQLSHAKWVNYVEMRTAKFFVDGQFNNSLPISEREADYLIDLHIIRKTEPEPF